MSSLSFNAGSSSLSGMPPSQELDKLPEQTGELIAFFEKICKQGETQEASLDACINKISLLNSSGQLNSEQIKKIAKISSSAYPSISSQSQAKIAQFMENTLKYENVFTYLKIALKSDNKKQIESCLQILNNEGISVQRLNGKVILDINLDKAREPDLNKLMKIFHDDSPKISMKLEKENKIALAGKIIQTHGEQFEKIHFNNVNISQNLINAVISHCRNLQELQFRSINNLSAEMLTHLDQLNLETLSILFCNSLQSLPVLPCSLLKLALTRCTNLITLPPLPINLKELIMGGCESFEKFAESENETFPAGLQKLDITLCASIKNIPRFSTSLHTFLAPACEQLTCLPNFNCQLRKVDISECPCLKSIPPVPATLKELIGADSIMQTDDDLEKLAKVTFDTDIKEGIEILSKLKDRNRADEFILHQLKEAFASNDNEKLRAIISLQAKVELNYSGLPAVEFAQVNDLDDRLKINIYIVNPFTTLNNVNIVIKYLRGKFPNIPVKVSLSSPLINQKISSTDEILTKISNLQALDKEALKSQLQSLDKKSFKQEISTGIMSFLRITEIAASLNDRPNLDIIKKHSEETLIHLDENREVLEEIFSDKELLFFHSMIKNIIEKTSINYLDEHKLLKGGKDAQPIGAAYEQWYISEAVLNESRKNLSPDQQKVLDHMILQTFRKSAGFREAESLNVQTSPLWGDEIKYHRHAATPITEKCAKAYAKELDVYDDELFLVHSPLIMEALRRKMPNRNNFKLSSRNAKANEQKTPTNNAADFFDNLNGYWQFLTNKNEKAILIDISELMINEKISPSRLENVMNDLYSIASKSHVNQELLEKLQFVALTTHKDQTILLTPHFGTGNSFGRFYIREVLNETGFRLSPAQTLEAWLKVESAEKILKEEKIPQALLATQGIEIPVVCKSFQDFITHPTFEKFKVLSEDQSAPPYLQVLCKSTSSLIEGLAKQNIDSRDSSGNYVGKYPEKMNDLLQISYFRMLNAMQEVNFRNAPTNKPGNAPTDKPGLRDYNYIDFHNQIEIIHQEIQAILSVAKPYNEGKSTQEGDFAKSVVANLQQQGTPIIPTAFTPKVHLKNSGMHAISSVLASVEAQKKGSQQINAMYLKGTYFETAMTIEDMAKDYTTHVLTPSEPVKSTYIADSLQARTQTFSTAHVHGDPSRATEPIDLFVCEFNHNAGLDTTHYYPEDLINQIKFLKKDKIQIPGEESRSRLADKCTIVIDNTINLEKGDNVRELFADAEIADWLKKGELNVILLRSAQKFDMLGLDNYYGGVTTTINNGTSFAAFDARMDHKQDQLTGFNYQGLTHLQKYGDLDSYRKAIHENSKKLYHKLPKDLMTGEQPFFKIVPMEDGCLYFINLKLGLQTLPNYFGVTDAFTQRMTDFAREKQIPLTNRSSFGFGNTNLSGLSITSSRLNPGLDDEKTLDLYVDFFKAVAELVNQAWEQQKVEQLPDIKMNEKLQELIKNMPLP